MCVKFRRLIISIIFEGSQSMNEDIIAEIVAGFIVLPVPDIKSVSDKGF